MKKFLCFALIIMSMFSCFIFSACSDEFEKLSMTFYSSAGEQIEEIKFVIDETKPSSLQRVSIQFDGIDQDQIGQIKVYSLPNELIIDSNYVYAGNTCYVDINPVKPNTGEAKLVVSHLASGKKAQIDLKIEQKSQNINILNSNYIVSIPEVNAVHYVDFSKVVSLLPVGSTDNIYFKVISNTAGIELIAAEHGEGMYSGFALNNSIANGSEVTIYPVPYIADYDNGDLDKYLNKPIKVVFRKTINQEGYDVVSKEGYAIADGIQLIANDTSLNNITLSLMYKGESIYTDRADGLEFHDLYKIELISEDEQKISAFIDSNNDIVLVANIHTEEFIDVEIALKPINYVGDIVRVSKTIRVKGDVAADDIEINKNNQLLIANDTNIFDYYEEGNALGALFTFKAVSNNGTDVHHDLNKMKILVAADILCEENRGYYLADEKRFTLMIHLYNDYLTFTYDNNLDLMVSEEITQENKIYIKYVKGDENKIESDNFSIKIVTTNNSTLDNWQALEPVEKVLNFNRVEGVKTMDYEVLIAADGIDAGGLPCKDISEVDENIENPEFVYLNRLDGVDVVDGTVKGFGVVKDSVLSVQGTTIPRVEFNVVVTPLFESTNNLTIYGGVCDVDNRAVNGIITQGSERIIYVYNNDAGADPNSQFISLIFRKDTDLGDYKITFYQEDVEKCSFICKVYEDITELTEDNIELETNAKAFRNYDYPGYEADYIVASGQTLDLGIYLDQDVLDSNIVSGYSVEFAVGVLVDNNGVLTIDAVPDAETYFDVSNTSFENTRSLVFKKGTYISNKPQYAYLIITVKTKNFSNIITVDDDDKSTAQYIISFFIYDEIQNDDISINHTSMTRYISKYLGAYYSDKSSAELEIEMSDSLWNYVTLSGAGNEVEWKIDVEHAANNFIKDGRKASVRFDEVLGQTQYVRVVRAYVRQFNKIFELQCVFNIEKPILSEKVIINSPIELRDDISQEYYINLKNGDTYTVEAKNYSGRGVVTHPEIEIQAFAANGSASAAKEYIEVDQTNKKIKVIKVDANAPELKLVVFARDVLRFQISSDMPGFNNPSSFILDYDGDEQGRYTGAYFVMDIDLSDGTEEHPYLIKNANDFWAIDDSDLARSAYYKLMTSISLNSSTDGNESDILNFNGFIKTYNDNIYIIDGINLINSRKNLFVNFSGEISNIKFVVNFDYNSTAHIGENLGLFDVNNGSLTDVSVVVSGASKLNDSNNVYNFGSLAGLNKGTIQYSETFGVIGSINLSGNATMNFGGLVGKNLSNIIGCEEDTNNNENKIVLNSNDGRQNVLSSLTINSELSGNSCIGGVVGYNSYVTGTSVGTIKNAYVQATINAENTSNVGGVIGKNEQEAREFNLSYSSYIVIDSSKLASILSDDCKNVAVYNVKSATTIKAKNNVGGIVGADKYGLFIECDYQIVSSVRKENAIVAEIYVGGIAGKSTYGKFAFCSVMSYWWNYAGLQDADKSTVITDVADIVGVDYVGGIVGFTVSDTNSVNNGPNSFANKVFVVSSSVNAYLQATKNDNGTLEGNIAGILCSDTTVGQIAIVYNAYFIGKLEGSVYYDIDTTQNGFETKTHYISISNNNNLLYNAVYTINIIQDGDNVEIKLGNIKDDREFDISNAQPHVPVPDYWAWNAKINGGYIFVTADNVNKTPIFDLAPDSIDVTVKDAISGLERVLLLDYYNFNQNTTLTDLQLAKLDEIYNRSEYIYKIDENTNENIGRLNIVAEPRGIGTVVVNVKSTNTNVIDITMDGRIIVKGVGESALIFSSLLNPNAGAEENRTIKVVVDYPLGNSFNISSSATDASKIINGSESIAKDTSKQYYVLTSGYIEHEFIVDGVAEEYYYRTKNDVHLSVKIAYENALTITDYIRISGKDVAQQTFNTLTVELDNKTPFIISVLKKLDTGCFNVEIKPYRVVDNKSVEYNIASVQFTLSTSEGVSSVFLSYDDAIVYPNDTVYFKAHLKTDKPIIMAGATLTASEHVAMQGFFEDLLTANGGYIENIALKKILSDASLISFKFFVDDATYDGETQIQTITFRVEFKEMNLIKEESLEFEFISKFGNTSLVKYKIIPQRIDKIEIKNYYFKNVLQDDGTVKKVLVQEKVLKPDMAGRMIIDIAPNNGYYSYLEISDITGKEEILFIQTNATFDTNINPNYNVSSDGKGIRIKSNPRDTIYILTQIDRTYSSKQHIVEIRAYSEDGTILYREHIVIDVKMLPEINVAYLLPDGSEGLVVNSEKINGDTTYIAKGVNANFNITTFNATTDLEFSLTGYEADGTESVALANKYVFFNEIGNHYVLQYNSQNLNLLDDDVNNTIRISFKTYSYFDNGDFEVAECYIQFKILDFVIHGISVNRSIDNKTTREIYGYYDDSVTLNFFLDKDDISFYDTETPNDSYWDTVYKKMDMSYVASLYGTDSIHYQIYNILDVLNNNPSNYLKINNSMIDEYGYYVDIAIPTDNAGNPLIELDTNKLLIKDGYNKIINAQGKEVVEDKYLAILFQIHEGTYRNWAISEYKDDTITKIKSYNINKNFKLNFKRATPWYEPTIVANEEQFMEMSSGGRYILARDLELEDYVPIDADLMEFDGNGFTITIRSFGLFNEKEINAGLFARIYENMVVKNVVVRYLTKDNYGVYSFGRVSSDKIRYGDLCNNSNIVNYEIAKFGGITAINEGVITNCKVIGTVALSASTIEDKKYGSAAGTDIEFYIGGVVADNSSSGYITHTTSELNIYSLANIGGFAYLNEGKIVSSSVEKNTTIYAYKGKSENLDKIVAVKVGGFVVENKNHISMSYVRLEKYVENNVNKGLIYAKDISAGFVYSNTGDISDSYTHIAQMGINSNTFSGFVYSNLGSITRSFSFINAGIRPSKDDAMFAIPGTSGLVDCIEFVKNLAAYNNDIESGLTTQNIDARFNQQTYKNFAFGDNESAVWTIQAGEMPLLVSTQEKVENSHGLLSIYSKTSEMVDGVIETTYHVNFASYGTKQNPYIVHDIESWNTYFTDNTMAYYRIVRDINFTLQGDNPITSTMIFKGNLQGNNMLLENIMLYSEEGLYSIGLFGQLVGVRDSELKNAVRNLKLTSTSVWASRTSAVGLLSGVIENFNLYNITIDAPNVIMVGGNAVGGLAGIVHGDFDIDQISSNIGANSTRASTLYNYDIYISKNNKKTNCYNLNRVYYAGSVVGILDGYNSSSFNVNSGRNLSQRFTVKNINVTGNITLLGDTVGSAFGFVGERVYVENANINVAGALAGVQYSSGFVGENRGVISNINIILADEIFTQSKNVSSGVVGLNLGGLIKDVEVSATITMKGYGKIVGGIVGRDINGTVNNVYFSGKLSSYFTGGVVGVSYTYDMLVEASSGAGTLSVYSKTEARNLIPATTVEYLEDGEPINNYENIIFSKETFDNMILSTKEYYSYKTSNSPSPEFNEMIVNAKVFGLIVGLGYKEVGFTDAGACNASIIVEGNDVIINKPEVGALVTERLYEVDKDTNEEIGVVIQDANDTQIRYIFENVRVYCPYAVANDTQPHVAKILYLTGAKVSTFDSWYKAYSEDFIIIMAQAPYVG